MSYKTTGHEMMSMLTGDTILRPKETAKTIGMSVSSVYRLAKNDPGFPKPVQLTEYRQGFWASEVREWLQNRPRC